jgi:hypothetical protein
MDMRKPHFHYLESSDEDSCDHIARIERATRLGRLPYVRVLDFLRAEIAERAYAELMEDPRYLRTDKMAKPTGIGLGILKSIDQGLSPHVQKCCDLLTSIPFRSWLAELVGYPLQTVKPPTLFRMERGDRIIRHDDVLDAPLNRVSVVLHLSKNWRREFGGNTVLGKVKRVENVRFGKSEYFQHRWVFSPKRSVLIPTFNSLLVIALKPGMAHGVTTLRARACRVSIVCLYGLEAENAE